MTTEANFTDRYGMPVTTNSQGALSHYAEGLDLALSQNFGAEEAFVRATDADEGFALAHASRAFMEFLRIAVPEAKASAETAVQLSSGLSRRERGFIDVVSKFVNGQNHAATAAIHEQLKEFPLDAMLLRLAQRLYTQGCVGIGAPDYPPRFYQLMTEAAPSYGEDWAFMGQYAWANHEVGKMTEGMDLAERSLELYPSNGVAAHSVAHVFYEMSQDDEERHSSAVGWRTTTGVPPTGFTCPGTRPFSSWRRAVTTRRWIGTRRTFAPRSRSSNTRPWRTARRWSGE